MRLNNDDEMFTSKCSICGGHIGCYGEDHTECSKEKQRIHAEDKRGCRAKKKLPKKSIDYLSGILK